MILESKDFRRSIDYLVSRPDVDRDRLGLLGVNLGGWTPVLALGEQRLKAAVFLGCGLSFNRRELPEADPFNFLSRFQVPPLIGRRPIRFPLSARNIHASDVSAAGRAGKGQAAVPLGWRPRAAQSSE
jgi:hypothetical protein